MRWVEWVEPFGPDNLPMFCRVSETSAIAVAKKLWNTPNRVHYENDQDALDDFMVVHWATFKEKP